MVPNATHSSDPYQLFRDRSIPWRVWLWALAGTLLVHVILFLFIPNTLGVMSGHRSVQPREFEILLAEEPPPVEDEEWVPTNPDALENEPDDTNLFASRNTQAADAIESEKDTEDSLAPTVDGESEEFNQVVEGSLTQPSPPAPTPSEQSQAQQASATAPIPVQPHEVEPTVAAETLQVVKPSRPVALEDEPVDEEGARAFPEIPEDPVEEDVDDPRDSEELDPEEFAEASEFPRYNPDQQNQPMVPPQEAAPQQPVVRQPQPRVTRTNTSPLKLNPEGVSRLAQTASYSARFSEYGEYLERLFETIELEWYRQNSMHRLTDRRTRVTISFELNEYGDVIDFKILDATASLQAQYICATAIKSRAPFGEWSEAMKKTLHHPETIVVNFLYY